MRFAIYRLQFDPLRMPAIGAGMQTTVRLRRAFIAAFVATNCTGCAFNRNGRIVPLENAIIYPASGPAPADWRPLGLRCEDVQFESADGTRLHGLFCPVENPRAVVLYFHGNGGNITNTAGVLRLITEKLHATAFAFDYRGYGRSEGKPNERGVLADARAARRWLAERTGIQERDIVLYGLSLGGGVAVDLAAKDGARGLILESTFTSAPAVANDLLPMWPGLLMFNRFNSLEKIADYRGPLLLSHGDADSLIPYAHGLRLFAAANEPKRFVPIAGADHDWEPPEYYLAELERFFDQLSAAETLTR
jgi:fermentation-respiration switch protein FrsA (DUF1100 family)